MILCFSHLFQMHSADLEIKISPGQQSSQDIFIHSLMLMNKLKSEMVRFYIEYRAQEAYRKYWVRARLTAHKDELIRLRI